ncbi:MAG: hypothetical protein ACYC5N_10070, partial [Endomicrobiales bacterium]
LGGIDASRVNVGSMTALMYYGNGSQLGNVTASSLSNGNYNVALSTFAIGGIDASRVSVGSMTAQMYYGDGSALAQVNAISLSGVISSTQISAGYLPADVIASSITVQAVHDGSIVSVSGSKITGDISVSTVTASGYFQLAPKSAEALRLITPAQAGQMYFNINVNKIFISTGTAQGAFAASDNYTVGP